MAFFMLLHTLNIGFDILNQRTLYSVMLFKVLKRIIIWVIGKISFSPAKGGTWALQVIITNLQQVYDYEDCWTVLHFSNLAIYKVKFVAIFNLCLQILVNVYTFKSTS